jgi:hypothetical protein
MTLGDDDGDGLIDGSGDADGEADGATDEGADGLGDGGELGVAVVATAFGAVTVYVIPASVAGRHLVEHAWAVRRWGPGAFGAGAPVRARTAVHDFGSRGTAEPTGMPSHENWAAG